MWWPSLAARCAAITMCERVGWAGVQEYALFGATLDARMKKDSEISMDSAIFMKLAKECGLVTRNCSLADIDVIFSKVRPRSATWKTQLCVVLTVLTASLWGVGQAKAPGSRRLVFSEFETALGMIGECLRLCPSVSLPTHREHLAWVRLSL